MRFLTIIAALAAVMALPAQAALYFGSRQLQDFSVRLAISTDGVSGPLSRANILDYGVVIDSGDGSVLLGPDNSELRIIGPGLLASPRALRFDFAGEGVLLFTAGNDLFSAAYCLNGALAPDPCIGPNANEFAAVSLFGGRGVDRSGAGLVTLASAAVPEPAAAWLVLGLPLALTLRRR